MLYLKNSAYWWYKQLRVARQASQAIVGVQRRNSVDGGLSLRRDRLSLLEAQVVSRVFMKVMLFSIGISALSLAVDAQRNGDDEEPTKQAGDLLRAHIDVVKQRYCRDDDEAFTASLDLRIRFTNSAGRPVILSRKIEPPPVVRVAVNADAAKKGTFIYAPDAHFTVASLPNSPHFGQAPDPKLFILLSPGESFETLIHTGVFGAYDGAKVTAGNGLLPKGSYLLQVGVPTWPYEWPYFGSKNDTQELKQRWSKYGDLVAGLLYTDFAPFTLTQQFKNPRCH